MSVQAIAIRLYLRYVIRPSLRPDQSPEALRRNIVETTGRMPAPPAGVTIEAVDAGGVKAQWVTAPGADPKRVIVHVHGGGYAAGSPKTAQDFCWRLSAASGARVLSVDYRLAPEHPFPAAVDDAATAWRWLLAQGIAPSSAAFVGDSAGGGLMFGALLKLRDEGAPMPAAAWALSAWADLKCDSPTMRDHAASDHMISAPILLPMAGWYLAGAAETPYASPILGDLRGLPPTLLHAGSTETLLDDSRRMAKKLEAAGVDTTLKVWPDMPHVFQVFAAFMPEGKQAIAEGGRFLRERMK